MKTYLQKSVFAALLLLAICTTASAYTAVASGNYSSAATWGGTSPGGTVTAQDIIIPAGITVQLDMDVTFTGGPINTFKVDGVLTNANLYTVTISQGSLSGAGTLVFHKLSFGPLGTISFTGTVGTHILENKGATLALTSAVNVVDTLNLDAGSITLNAGANLTPYTHSTIRVNTGTLSNSAGIYTPNDYNIWYVGATKTAGLELNSPVINNVTLDMTDNTQSVSLTSALIVKGVMNMKSGLLNLNSNTLTIGGDLIVISGSALVSTSTGSLSFTGTGSPTSAVAFSTGSTIKNFTLNRTGNAVVKLSSPVTVTGQIQLQGGTFSLESGSNLTMSAGSIVVVNGGAMVANSGLFTGTAAYDVQYMGGTTATGPELTGSGLNNLTIALALNSSIVTLGQNASTAGTTTLTSGKFDLHGHNLTMTGLFTQTPKACFIGNVASELAVNLATVLHDTLRFDVSNQNLSKLIINPPTAGTIYLASPVTIVSELNLGNGKLDIGNSDLTLLSSASVTGSTDTKYVVTSGAGRLQMNVSSTSAYTLFPIGTSANYSPAQLEQVPGGINGDFMIRAMPGVYTNGTTGFNTANAYSSVNRTWLVTAVAGNTVNVNMKLGWVAAAEVNSFNRAASYISRYASNMWDTYPVSGANAGANNTYEITRTGITSISPATPFAVGDMNSALGITESAVVTEISLYPNPATDAVSIEVPATGSTVVYEVYDITGKSVASLTSVSSLNRMDISSFPKGVYFIKITNTENQKAITKRFVKS
jgi:hypothetical protein